MKRVRIYGIILLLFAILLSGCSKESMMEKGTQLLDKMFAGDTSDSKPSTGQKAAAPSAPQADPEPAGQEPEENHFPGAVEPSIPDQPTASEEPPAPEPSAEEPSPSAPAGGVTPSHTDVTLFEPGESFKYLPKGVTGIYACIYASEDETIASVDSDTGTVTAVSPGTTKVTMHVECNGQYDFSCIIRCSWKEEEPKLPGGTVEPALPPASPKPADTPASSAGTISASHTDATFFNPEEHFQLLPVGVGGDCTCMYTTGDASIASVDEKGVVTAVGPGTTTVTMLLEAGGTEYIFNCIVRCNWS